MALQLTKEQDHLASAFGEFLEHRTATEPAWLPLLRQKSFARFEAAGFPTVKDEDWKYTNVAPISKSEFVPVVAAQTSDLAKDLESFDYPELRESTLVFANGVYQAELSRLQSLSAAVVMTFADALAGNHEGKWQGRPARDNTRRMRVPQIIREHYERNDSDDENGFTSLNTAFAEGVLIVIPANTRLEAPIHLLFTTASGNGHVAACPRVLIVAEDNASATIVENYASVSQTQYLTNSRVDLVLAGGAQLQHYKVQRESMDAFHIATTTADLGASANYDTTTINFGAALSRHGIEVRMDHEGAQCAVDGLYMVDGNQHTDTHSIIDHRQPRCASHQLYKGILDGKSRAVFNGKVFVRHGAQQTDAKQTNKNLLLSPDARVDTKPQLEIFADDVKCAHGAAVGQLDPDERFYLESRGLNPTLTRNLLTYGFAEEVIEKIKIDSIRRELDSVVLNRLGATSVARGLEELG